MAVQNTKATLEALIAAQYDAVSASNLVSAADEADALRSLMNAIRWGAFTDASFVAKVTELLEALPENDRLDALKLRNLEAVAERITYDPGTRDLAIQREGTLDTSPDQKLPLAGEGDNAGLMSNEEHGKLATIARGAEVNLTTEAMQDLSHIHI